MASDKVVDINPSKRINKEFLQEIKNRVNNLTVDKTQALLMIYDEDGDIVCDTYGLDWATLGIAQAYLDDFRRKLLYNEGDESD